MMSDILNNGLGGAKLYRLQVSCVGGMYLVVP